MNDYHVQVVAAEIDTRNVPSMRLLEALGFTRVATLRGADVFTGAVSDDYRYERRSAAPTRRHLAVPPHSVVSV